MTAVHFGAEETEVLETEDNNTEEIRFEAESFSVYGILYTVDLHTECITAEGRTYNITVSYTEDAGLPEDAALDVREITPGKVLYGEYALKAEEILGWQEETPSYMRLFDISIVDGDGRKIEIGAPVDVRIELADGICDTAQVDECCIGKARFPQTAAVVHAVLDVKSHYFQFHVKTPNPVYPAPGGSQQKESTYSAVRAPR